MGQRVATAHDQASERPPDRALRPDHGGRRDGLEAEADEPEPVFSGGNLHNRRSSIPQQPQTSQIVRGYGLFKPFHVQFGKFLSLSQGLLPAIGSVGIHEQLRIGPDGFASLTNSFQVQTRIASNFHLHPRDTLFDPIVELSLQLIGRIGRETTTAINRYRLSGRA